PAALSLAPSGSVIVHDPRIAREQTLHSGQMVLTHSGPVITRWYSELLSHGIKTARNTVSVHRGGISLTTRENPELSETKRPSPTGV
ncbi:MAG: hypothetical protein M0Q91_13920, partial [Methanoregula sp.]|nr:hypothetical protein [Methanoregula sp.]